MDSKGQISAEYLLLIAVVLVIISAVTIPLIDKSISASNDVSNVADAKKTVTEIANAVNIVYANGPGAKRTLSIYSTQNMALQASTGVITLNSTPKPVNSTVSFPVTIVGGTLTKNTWYTSTVKWTPGSSTITVTMNKS